MTSQTVKSDERSLTLPFSTLSQGLITQPEQPLPPRSRSVAYYIHVYNLLQWLSLLARAAPPSEIWRRISPTPGGAQNDNPRRLANDVRRGKTRSHPHKTANREAAPVRREKLVEIGTGMTPRAGREATEKGASTTTAVTIIAHLRGGGTVPIAASTKRAAPKWQSWPWPGPPWASGLATSSPKRSTNGTKTTIMTTTIIITDDDGDDPGTKNDGRRP